MYDLSKKSHDLRKQIHGLGRIEKGKLYGGDRTILYEKMGLIDENDIEKYRKKLGIKKEINVAELDEETLDLILENKEQGTRKKSRSPLQIAKKEFEKEELKKIVLDY